MRSSTMRRLLRPRRIRFLAAVFVFYTVAGYAGMGAWMVVFGPGPPSHGLKAAGTLLSGAAAAVVAHREGGTKTRIMGAYLVASVGMGAAMAAALDASVLALGALVGPLLGMPALLGALPVALVAEAALLRRWQEAKECSRIRHDG